MAVICTPFAEPNRPGAATTSCSLAAVQRGPLTPKFLICAVTGLVGSSELGSLAGCSSESAFLCRSARFAAPVCRFLKCLRQFQTAAANPPNLQTNTLPLLQPPNNPTTL